ncbi:MAG: excisionase [Eubacterium sp.]
MEENTGSLGDIPVWKRYTLTIVEAATYYHIGEKKLRQIAELYTDGDFLLLIGNKVLFKREKFESFLDDSNSI